MVTRRTGGIYLSLPYCLSHCHYCSNPATPYSGDGAERYTDKLIADLIAAGPDWQHHTIDTVYLGGGTPTLFAAPLLRRIMATLGQHFDLDPNAEVTSEANPETVTPSVAEGLLAIGVNRISIGAQSFQPAQLAALGRRHDPAAIGAAVAAARAAGFDNLSLDLIFAVPGQTPANWKDDLGRAIDLNPDHLSAYALTLERGTVLFDRVAAGKATAPSEADGADFYAMGVTQLAEAGYRPYEISNFSRPGRQCRHNKRYWQAGDWLGIGAGAASALGPERFGWPARVEAYLAAPGPEWRETLTPAERAHEAAIFAMRTADGLEPEAVGRRFGIDLGAALAPALAQLTAEGLVVQRGGRVTLTPRGFLFADRVGAALSGD